MSLSHIISPSSSNKKVFIPPLWKISVTNVKETIWFWIILDINKQLDIYHEFVSWRYR